MKAIRGRSPNSDSCASPELGLRPRIAVLVLLILALAGCGERQEARQARLYGPDAYRVAGDTTAWSNPPFNGDQSAWEHEIDARARQQNEYQRIR